jgi:hypothetical protein
MGDPAGIVLAAAHVSKEFSGAFVRDHIIRVTEQAFDDFAGAGSDKTAVSTVRGR